jgi:hypothetical protein
MQQIIFDPVSNRETWSDTVELHSDQDDSLVDLSTATIVLSLRDKRSLRTLLTARVGSGIAIESLGVFVFTFTVQQMRTLDASIAYELGCTCDLDSTGTDVQQVFIGKLSVIDGVVE